MGRRSTIVGHIWQEEIEAAIHSGRSDREVARAYGVSRSAVQRHRYGLIPPASDTLSLPGAENPSNPSPAHGSAPIPAQPGRPGITGQGYGQPNVDAASTSMDTAGTFDLTRLSYPWRPGESPNPDPVAAQLRAKQARSGSASVRRTVLDMVEDTSHTMDIDSIARKLDVPPHMIQVWLNIRKEERRARISGDPTDEALSEIAELEMVKHYYQRVIADPRSPASQVNIATEKLLRVNRDIRVIKEQYGMIRQAPIPDPPDHGRDLLIEGIKEMIAAVLEAQNVLDENGVDPTTVYPEATPERVAEGRAAYDQRLAKFPDTTLPPFREDDPFGWTRAEQKGRLIKARKLATGRQSQSGHKPGVDDVPVPGVNYIPRDVSQVAEFIRLQEERAELGLEPLPDPDLEGEGDDEDLEAACSPAA